MVFIVVMLIFLGFAIAITLRPSTVVALAICVYAFEQWAQANSSYFGQHAAFINLCFGVLSLYAVACTVLHGRNPLNPLTGAMWCWIGLYFLAAVSCLWSIDRSLSIFLFKYNLPYVVTFVGLVPLVIQNRDDARHALMSTLVFGSIVMGLLLVGTHIHSWGRTIVVAEGAAVLDRVGNMRTRLGPLAIAELAGQMLILAVLLNFKGVGRIWQYMRWVIVFLALGLIYRSGSRGQLISALLAILMFITFSRGTKRVTGWVTAAASACMVLGFAAWSYVGNVEKGSRWSLETMQTTFASTRLEYCAKVLKFWIESSPFSWIFGLGSSASYDVRILGHYCHVTVVEVLAELGLIGFILLMAFTILVTRDLIRLYYMTKESDVDRGVTTAFAALFTFSVILSFKQGSFLTNTFALGCGLMISRHAAIMRTAFHRAHVRELHRRWSAYYSQFGQAYAPSQASPQG